MKKYDLIVVGGGFAGFGAAVCAAREGVKTLLIEKTNALSGEANTGLVLPFMRFHTTVGTDDDGKAIIKELSTGVFKELLRRLDYDKALQGHTFDSEHLKLVMNRMAIESGVELLFNATVVSAKRDGNSIKSVNVFSRGNTIELESDYFIDCTGDANLIAMTGFSYKVGREKDGLCQPMTLCFRMADIDRTRTPKANEINSLYKKLKAEGKISNPREDVLMFHTLSSDTVHFNTTRIVKLNPTDMFDVTRAEIEAREQMAEMVEFLKSNIAGYENAYVVTSATEIGIRESRMVEGEYTLSGDDLKSCAKFGDSIATGNYDIDIHNPEGEGTSHYFFPAGEYYEIPYRVLIPKNAENILVAGRCISVDHEAQASIRIMPIACTLGQAAGTAIAIAKNENTTVKDIDVDKLQKTLIKNGATIH